MPDILVIDDDIEACETMVSLLTRLEYRSAKAHNLQEGLTQIEKLSFDVVFLDVFLPDGNGLDILPAIMQRQNPPEVIILTGRGNPDGAELAIQGGVWDYLLKPTSVKDITLTLNRALKYRREKQNNSPRKTSNIDGIIGSSSSINAIQKLAHKAALADSNILITGETGTGKELFSSKIHDCSGRAGGNFVVVDCTALTETLVESTLFGHLKGAFTGAQTDYQGLVKTAHNGTLFLDEVGEMPLSIQKVFLRVLQERQFRPVGSTKVETSNFRLIAATNRDLDQMAEEGLFRRDLLFRIKTMRLHIPPLRHRKEDIPALVNHRIVTLCKEFGLQDKEIDEDVLKILDEYHWPGNVRELFNIIERALIDAGEENTLYSMHLPRTLRIQVAKNQIAKLNTREQGDANNSVDPLVQNIGQDIFEDIFDRPLPPLKQFKNEAEKTYLGELIRQCDGNIQKIMSISGLSRSHFYALLKKYNLSQ